MRIGMRNQYTYSPTERYEHIYLNDNFTPGSVWTVWKGAGGCRSLPLRAGGGGSLSVCLARENHSHAGVILIDLQQMRTDGKIMGYQGSDFGALSNFPVGASAKILNVTRHQE